MPTLFRFLIVLLVLGVVVAAGMFYLGNYVGPRTREITVPVAPEHLTPVPQ